MKMIHNNYYVFTNSIMQFIVEDDVYYYGTLCFLCSPLEMVRGKVKWVKVKDKDHKVTKYSKAKVVKCKEVTKKDLFIMCL